MNMTPITWVRRFRLVFTAGALFAFCYSALGDVIPQPPVNYYMLASPTGLADQFKSLFRFAGITHPAKLSEDVQESLGKLKFVTQQDDPTAFFSQDMNNGALSFSKSIKKYEGDFKPTLPGVEEAQIIAETFLRDNNLLPQKLEELKLADVQTIGAARPKFAGQQFDAHDNPALQFDKLRIVTFRREINGIPVIGPGSKIVVTIGDKNEIIGVIRRWREYTQVTPPTDQNPLISLEEARKGFQQRIEGAFGAANPTIAHEGVAFYDSNDKFIQPVYVFETQLGVQQRGPGADSNDLFLGLIPALKAPPEYIFQLNDPANSPTPKLANISGRDIDENEGDEGRGKGRKKGGNDKGHDKGGNGKED